MKTVWTEAHQRRLVSNLRNTPTPPNEPGGRTLIPLRSSHEWRGKVSRRFHALRIIEQQEKLTVIKIQKWFSIPPLEKWSVQTDEKLQYDFVTRRCSMSSSRTMSLKSSCLDHLYHLAITLRVCGFVFVHAAKLPKEPSFVTIFKIGF